MSRRWGRGWSRGYERYDRFWPRYVPVAERRAKAERQKEKLRKKGEKLDPVVIAGRAIARTFWGKGWCDHLEGHCDFWNRLGRGRDYVRNGSVCDLVIEPGRVRARVAGTALYRVEIGIKKLPPARWKAIRQASTGRIDSVVELLQGRLSDAVMSVMTHPKSGLFPRGNEIEMKCTCPDYAVMCKHVAATLYGVGARLDDRPELLFVLRGVDTAELFDEAVESGVVKKARSGPAGLEERDLSEIFGVEIEAMEAAPSKDAPKARRKKAARGTKGTPARGTGATRPLPPAKEKGRRTGKKRALLGETKAAMARARARAKRKMKDIGRRRSR
ncbi:MAG: SWIM zinc finger family protein [Clostridiales bacterium]|nr:SWIM zinc finger family protein [Clostridiales bacterium]